MSMSVRWTSSSNQLSFAFLETATKDYLAARTLFLGGQFYDAGFLAHEALEKIMKALLYFHFPSESFTGHNLNTLILPNPKPGKPDIEKIGLRETIEQKLITDLSMFKDAFDYYEKCYKYRYPDDPNLPKDFYTGTNMIHALDKNFIYFHDQCLGQISDPKVKNRTGIYKLCEDYFEVEIDSLLQNLLERNAEINLAQIDTVKDFWHSQGVYKENEQGFTKYPDGTLKRRHLS